MNKIDKIKLELGYVVLLSQLIESHLSSILLVLNNTDSLSITDTELQSQHKKLSRKTLGILSKLLINSKKISDPKKTLDAIEDCRVERNFLIHELSSCHEYDFSTESGRHKVLERIYKGKDKILIGTIIVQNLMEKLVAASGGNIDAMKSEARESFE